MDPFQIYSFYGHIQLTLIATDFYIMIESSIICCSMDYPKHSNKLLACGDKGFSMQMETVCTVKRTLCSTSELRLFQPRMN